MSQFPPIPIIVTTHLPNISYSLFTELAIPPTVPRPSAVLLEALELMTAVLTSS